jgi:hypothetical protein
MPPLPNPDTYLNHIPPTQAAQFEAARNLSLAVLGVCTSIFHDFCIILIDHCVLGDDMGYPGVCPSRCEYPVSELLSSGHHLFYNVKVLIPFPPLKESRCS